MLRRETLTIPCVELEIAGRSFVLQEMSGAARENLQLLQREAADGLIAAMQGAVARDPEACIREVRAAVEAGGDVASAVKLALERYDSAERSEEAIRAAVKRSESKSDEILKSLLVDRDGNGVDDEWLEQNVTYTMRKRIAEVQRELNCDDEVADSLGKLRALLPGT